MCVEPMRVTPNLDVDHSQVNANPRMHPYKKSTWLREHTLLLCKVTILYPNPQAVCASVTMIFNKGPDEGYRWVVGFSLTNDQWEQRPGHMKASEIRGEKCADTVAFITMDYLEGYWQRPLEEEAEELSAS